MELYVASARAKNWIGDADPIFQTFNDEIIKYVVICSTSYAIRFTKASVIKRLSAIILLSMLKSTLKPRNPRALSVLWGILGFEQRDNIKEELLNELHGPKGGTITNDELVQIDEGDSLHHLRALRHLIIRPTKKTTKKTEKYSEFEGSLPTTDSVLSLSDVLPMPYSTSSAYNISRAYDVTYMPHIKRLVWKTSRVKYT